MMQKDHGFLMYFGADPEFFIQDKTGTVLAAHQIDIPVSGKEITHSTESGIRLSGSFFRDGAALELNPTFSTCRQSLILNTLFLLGKVKEIFKLEEQNLHITSLAATENIPMAVFENGPPDVKRWGCNPSLLAYEPGIPQVPPCGALETPIRTTGGHIHLTSTDPDSVLHIPELYPDLVRLLDIYVGLPFTFLLGDMPGQALRRTLYGVAGEYREVKRQVYMGIEYRTLPSAMWHSSWLASLALGSVREVARRFWELQPILAQIDSYRVRGIINTSDAQGAFPEILPLAGFYTPELLSRMKKHIPDSLERFMQERVNVYPYGWGDVSKNLGYGNLIPSPGERGHYDPNSNW